MPRIIVQNKRGKKPSFKKVPKGKQRKPMSKGICHLCNKTFKKQTLIQHFPCPKETPSTPTTVNTLRFYAEVSRWGEFYIYLDTSNDASFNEVHKFLRKELFDSDHLSQFKVKGKRYECQGFKPYPEKSNTKISSLGLNVGDVIE
eukprot:TRINITY_DN1604_c2_g1_i1.p1 TRINITY_DN1604_c2_g1~~TRINITY_DN1604_c2_g1_i1.p1  ORF type:complete len:145 (-),score=16.70 TRINITY_DN1604_c2_g1_i1:251-685(-)